MYKKNYFFQKKTLAQPHVTLFESRPTVMNWTAPDLYINLEKRKFEKNLKNDWKKWFFFFLKGLTLGKCPTRDQPHVARGITCPTAYILHPRAKGHPKRNKNKKKLTKFFIFFQKKNPCPTAFYAVRIESNPPALDVPRSLHQPGRNKFRKKLEKWLKKMIFLFFPTLFKA